MYNDSRNCVTSEVRDRMFQLYGKKAETLQEKLTAE